MSAQGLLFWVLVCVIEGAIACALFQAKNRLGRDGFVLGLFLGPIGLVVALCLSKLPALPAAGWYPDPADGEQRWWDGARWSDPVPLMPKPYEPDAEVS
jgi:hypothetical protein